MTFLVNATYTKIGKCSVEFKWIYPQSNGGWHVPSRKQIRQVRYQKRSFDIDPYSIIVSTAKMSKNRFMTALVSRGGQAMTKTLMQDPVRDT